MDALSNSREARLRYLPNDIDVIREGSFVRCAVTGRPIPLANLRYWNVALQEPYYDAEVALQRWRELQPRK